MKTIELAEAKRLVAEGGRLPDTERRQLQQQHLLLRSVPSSFRYVF